MYDFNVYYILEIKTDQRWYVRIVNMLVYFNWTLRQIFYCDYLWASGRERKSNLAFLLLLEEWLNTILHTYFGFPELCAFGLFRDRSRFRPFPTLSFASRRRKHVAWLRCRPPRSVQSTCCLPQQNVFLFFFYTSFPRFIRWFIAPYHCIIPLRCTHIVYFILFLFLFFLSFFDAEDSSSTPTRVTKSFCWPRHTADRNTRTAN